MTAQADIAAIADGASNPASRVRTALTSVLENVPVVSVTDYGATGDGTTDDTAACQAAIHAAEAVTVGIATVYFPTGVYVVEPLYVESSNVRVVGDGKGSMLRLAPGTYNPSDSIGVLNFHGTAMERLSGCSVERVAVDGNRSNVTNSGDEFDLECFSFTYTDEMHVVDCYAIDAYADGFDFDESADGTVRGCYADSCGGAGFHISINSTRIRVSDSFAYNCGDELSTKRSGFDTVTSVSDSAFINCVARDCYRGFYLQGTDNSVVGCFSVGGEHNALRVGGVRMVASGCHFTNPATGNVVTVEAGGDNFTMTGCILNGGVNNIAVISGGDQFCLTGNIGLNSDSVGFNIDASNGLVVGNVIKNAGGSPIDDSGSGNTVISNEA